MARSWNAPRVADADLSRIAFRTTDYDVPFWAEPNTEAQRWSLPTHGPTQYWSLSPNACWAEIARRDALRSEGEMALLRTPIWIALFADQMIADYSTFSVVESYGFDPYALVDEDHTRCQDEALRLRTNGFRGVIAPSAALPGALNLTLFGARVRGAWGTPPRLASSVPAIVVSVGAPPRGVVGKVRHPGAPHALYEEYRIQPKATPPSSNEPPGHEGDEDLEA